MIVAEIISGQFPRIFLVFFLTSFAAFFSLGVIAGFFLASRLFLCSLLMLFTLGKQWGISSNRPFFKADSIWLKLFASTEIDEDVVRLVMQLWEGHYSARGKLTLAEEIYQVTLA